MLAPVIIDLGPDVAPPALEIVLDACNEVIQNGVCLPEGAAYTEAPRATAIARPDGSILIVHIEVQLGSSEEGPWLVRELRFGAQDPTAERWRSVGLAIATLVGEGERRQAEQATAGAEPAQTEMPEAAQAAAPEIAAPKAPTTPLPAEASAPPMVSQEEPDTAGASSPWAPVYIGLGVVAGPGFDDGVWRLGGSARAGWGLAHGLQLVTYVDYSWRLSANDYTASWLSLQAGLGYRLRLSKRVSSAISVRGGMQQMRFEALARGEATSDVTWNPLLGVGIDGWWLVTPNVGIWAAADAQTLARETRLFVAPERDVVTSHVVDVSLAIGLGWWLP